MKLTEVHADSLLNFSYLFTSLFTMCIQSVSFALNLVHKYFSKYLEIFLEIFQWTSDQTFQIQHLHKSCWSHSYNAFCGMFYSDCLKWPPFAATQERRRQRHCLTALSITLWSRCSPSSTIHYCNSSTVWIILYVTWPINSITKTL